jgi:hypothetical protein
LLPAPVSWVGGFEPFVSRLFLSLFSPPFSPFSQQQMVRSKIARRVTKNQLEDASETLIHFLYFHRILRVF